MRFGDQRRPDWFSSLTFPSFSFALVGGFFILDRMCDVASWQILLQKSKIEQFQKSRKNRFFANSIAEITFSADTKVSDRPSEKRHGSSPRCAQNASTVPKIIVCYPKRLFQHYRHLADMA